MRSLADRVRLERVLRGVAMLALSLWLANAAWPRSGRTAFIGGDALEGALARLTTVERPESVHVQLDTVPDALTARWLAALRGAGIGVSWSGAVGGAGALALETFRSPDPAGGIVLLAATPRPASILSDGLGPIDTISVVRAPAVVRLASVEGDVTLRSGAQPARAGVAPPAAPRRVFVAGAAGWEAKFAIAALEESGWTVDARLFVRPDMDVTQGGATRVRLDTSRYAAVVLMDSAAAETMPVAEFVRAGGGVVLAGDANRARRIAALVGWRGGTRESAPLGTLPGDTAWRGLSRFVLDSIPERRAVTLEERDGKAIVVARRHYAGRVMGIGYDQTWRWRMAGGDNSAAEHRAWWSRAVAGVTATADITTETTTEMTTSARTGAAPLASLYDVLGPPSELRRGLVASFPAALFSNLLGALCLTALLAEWMLRRSRGAR